MADKKPTPTIVAAVGSAAAHPKASTKAPTGPSGSSIQQAMADAVTKALAEGVTDQDEIRKRQLDARELATKNK